MPSLDDIQHLFQARGDSPYGGECVSQQEHALQCATLAESEGTAPSLIVAALLHDVGHLLHDLPMDAPDKGIDDHHETSAAAWLRKLFPPEVTEPIALHVTAKRYLCAVDPGYLAQLSLPSVVSLKLQGGPMSSEEVTQFQMHPFAEEAIRLRRWDDAAKVPELPTPELSHFTVYFEKIAAKTDNR